VRRCSERGSLLILALWSLSLFAVFAVSIGYSARARASLLARLETADRLLTIGACGIERARDAVLEDLTPDLDTLTDSWTGGTFFRSISAGDGFFTVFYEVPDPKGKTPAAVRYGALDAESRLNLNTADAGSIARLLQEVTTLGSDEAAELAQCIVDWRDQDSQFQHPNYGFEDSEYDDLSEPYACKDAPIGAPEELLLIKGMKRDIFNKMRPFVTFWGTGSVNLNTAPPETLLALGLSRGAVAKVLAFRAGADGLAGTADDEIFAQAGTILSAMDRAVPPLDGAERSKMEELINAERLGAQSSVFQARSRGYLSVDDNGSPAGPFLEVEAAFERSGRVLYWRSSGVRWPSRASS